MPLAGKLLLDSAAPLDAIDARFALSRGLAAFGRNSKQKTIVVSGPHQQRDARKDKLVGERADEGCINRPLLLLFLLLLLLSMWFNSCCCCCCADVMSGLLSSSSLTGEMRTMPSCAAAASAAASMFDDDAPPTAFELLLTFDIGAPTATLPPPFDVAPGAATAAVAAAAVATAAGFADETFAANELEASDDCGC